jgi:hypothetical protein
MRFFLAFVIVSGLAVAMNYVIRERTSEGRKRAMAESRRFGRKPKLTPHQRAEALEAPRGGRDAGFDR